MSDFFIRSWKPAVFQTHEVKGTDPAEKGVFDRHTLLTGFDQEALSRTHVCLAGGGGLGSEIGMALVRKGIGRLSVFDRDPVEITNLARQHFFQKDLYKPKGICLAENLAAMAPGATRIEGYAEWIEDGTAAEGFTKPDILVAAVDNSRARFFCASLFDDVPVIYTAVNAEADSGYVFVQVPGQACFGCLFADEHGRPARPCSGSSIDINKIMGGLVSYAVDSLVMARSRDWNYKRVSLCGPLQDTSKEVPVNPECSFCGGSGRPIRL